LVNHLCKTHIITIVDFINYLHFQLCLQNVTNSKKQDKSVRIKRGSFEFDLWTPNSTTFKYKLVDFGADGAFGGGDDKEHELTLTPTLNAWNHVAVSLADFAGLTTKSNIAQLVFASVPSGTSIAYIDNVLFSKKTQTGVSKVNAETIGIYPNPANNNFSITASNTIQEVTIYNALGQTVLAKYVSSNFADMDITTLPKGIYTIKTTVNGTDNFSKLIKE